MAIAGLDLGAQTAMIAAGEQRWRGDLAQLSAK